MSKTVLLLDGDVFAYQAAAVTEKEVQWPGDIWTLHSDLESAEDHAKNRIETLRKQLRADEVVFCWSCPTGRYWRHDIIPSYKGHRKATRKPLALKELKARLAEHYESFMRPTLEADDVMGILSTWPKYKPGTRKIIVSIDKDMQTIPGFLFNPDKDYQPWEVSQEHADRFHLAQALGGDMTDGYPGCPQVGFDSAMTALETLEVPLPYEHTFKSGARAGTTETRYAKDVVETPWEVVMALYSKAGQTEVEALRNARVARILRIEDYDVKNKEVRLWQPPK